MEHEAPRLVAESIRKGLGKRQQHSKKQFMTVVSRNNKDISTVELVYASSVTPKEYLNLLRM